jgi:ABC-type transport system involved in cytochrome c biogenesis ATPase subunit
MKLTHVRIARLGPFYFDHEIEIDSQVTILTGSNDAGKTSIIRMIELFLQNKSAGEMDINQDYLRESQTKWTDDTTPRVELQFHLESSREVDGGNYNYNHHPGDLAIASKQMARQGTHYGFQVRSRNHGNPGWPIFLPRVISGLGTNAIREQLDLSAPNPLESALLHLGFGAPFEFERLNALSPINFSKQLLDAEERINQAMARSMPLPSSLRFKLLPIEGSRKMLAVLLRDRHDAMTPFGLRGTGLKKMVTLIAQLLTATPKGNHRIFLFDEPETSLHADAQHLLREFLFDLTSRGDAQVIYATHSSCMINPMRPEQIRLLQRVTLNGKPTSSIQPQPTDSNFLALRTSLGISPSDSLLFAPVTVVIEGDTEFKCLAPLIRKLMSANLAGFGRAAKILSLTHFLDGMGDSYEYLCRLAKSQGTRVVLFLDGDKRSRLEQQKIASIHPDVILIVLPGREEFEQLVQIDVYFEALAAELGSPKKGQELKQQWQSWLAADENRSRRVFSKQVWNWVDDAYPVATVTKPAVMRTAVEMAKPEEINAEPIRQLLDAIEAHLANTSF